METAADADEWIAVFLGEHPEELDGAWLMSAEMDAALVRMGGIGGMAKSLASLGTIEKIGSAFESEVQGYQTFNIPCVFSAMSLNLILVDHDKEHLRYCRDEIERKLHDLGLTLNKKTGLFPLKNGVIILKWRFVLTKSGAVKRIMNREKITHQKKKVAKILDRESHGMCEPGTADASMQS